MRGRDRSHRGLVHLIAGMALGAAGVLVAWIVAGGTPFGHVIGGGDVSAPTSAVAAQTAAERRAGSAATVGSRLRARPPELVSAPELRFMEPKRSKASKPSKQAAKARPARTRTAKPRRPVRPRPRPSAPVVRVVSPPGTDETAAVAPVPTTAPVPAPPPAAAAPAPGGAGGGPAKPRPAGGTMEG